jgi:peptidoglycan/xylan/chitin deacetylase (PgdA/CDA1 family)
MGLHLVSWTRRGFDTRRNDAGKVAAKLMGGLAGGDILLLHDGHASRTVHGRPLLLEALPPLLKHCNALGLRCATLAEALPVRHP